MYLHQTGGKNDDWPRHIVSEKDHLLNPIVPEDLDPISKLVVFSHGFESKKDAFEKMASEVIYHDQNVTTLVVDWSVGAKRDHSCEGFPGYLCAASNVRYVGAAIERVVRKLVTEKSEDPESVYIHCMGHSLGAHVCGFFGKYVKVKICLSKIFTLQDYFQ